MKNLSGEKLEADYTALIRKVEAQAQAEREKVKADLLALKAKTEDLAMAN